MEFHKILNRQKRETRQTICTFRETWRNQETYRETVIIIHNGIEYSYISSINSTLFKDKHSKKSYKRLDNDIETPTHGQ